MKENLYVSMYTVDTPYEEEVKKLEASLEVLGLSYELVPIECRGSWAKNTHQKPEVIKDMMLKHNKNIIFLDADSIVLKEPVLFNGLDCDLGINHISLKPELYWSGLTYYANNEKVIILLDRWIELLENERNRMDEFALTKAINENISDLKIEKLPEEYAGTMYTNGENQVITHHRKSRELKNIMFNTETEI